MSRLVHEYWFRWETALWRGDLRLNMCGALARGVWTEAIMCMREGKPGGYLTDPATGAALTLDEMASAFRLPLEEVRDGLDELRRRGVFSVREDGAIFSRKIAREMALSAVRSKAARGRGKHSRPIAGFAASFAETNGPTKTQQNVSSEFLDLSSSSEGSGGGADGQSAFEFVDHLFSIFLWHNPQHKDKGSWPVAGRAKAASDVLSLRRDGVDWDRMRAVADWMRADPKEGAWWLGRISDAAGFVRNFRQLEAAMIASRKAAVRADEKPSAPRLKTPDEQAAADPEAAERLAEFRARYRGGK